MTAGYNTGRGCVFPAVGNRWNWGKCPKSHQKKAARGAFRDRFSRYVQWLTGDLSGVALRLKGGQYYLCHDLVGENPQTSVSPRLKLRDADPRFFLWKNFTKLQGCNLWFGSFGGMGTIPLIWKTCEVGEVAVFWTVLFAPNGGLFTGFIVERPGLGIATLWKLCQHRSGPWCDTFFSFTPKPWNDPIWRIFFRWVGTTN